MKLFGLTLVKNEADIIEYALKKNLAWFDRILILDNGSTDGSFEALSEMAAKEPRISVERTDLPFRDGLRSLLFTNYKHEASIGDWWCRLDADEVYHSDPRETLATVGRLEHVVWSQHLNFYLTELDVARFENTMHSNEIPQFTDEMYPTHFASNFSEQRFFRHRPRLRWDDIEMSWPKHVGLDARGTALVHHLQYRSPQQVDLRLKTRRAAAADGYRTFQKDSGSTDWTSKVSDSKKLKAYVSDDEVERLWTTVRVSPRSLAKWIGHACRVLP